MESEIDKDASASKVQTSSSSSKRSDDTRFLFLFVRREDGVYLLYKIDFVDCLEKKNSEVPLSPLIVFSKKCLASDSYFAFVFLEPYFYFIGGDNNKIFTIRKSRLLNIDPSEKRRGSNLLKPLATQMNGTKLYPLAFTYQNKLYVISKGYYPPLQQIGRIYFDFEVYSPETKSWTNLGNKPLRDCCIRSYFVLHDTVYFTTASHVVVSFDLVNELWISILDPYGVLAPYPETFFVIPRPTFDSDIQIIGNTVFGGIYRPYNDFLDISASPVLTPNDDMFLRPSLTHDRAFYDYIYAVPHLTHQDISFCSKSFVTVDNEKQIMCVIGYGNDPSDHLANYAVLTFFRVHDDSYQGDIIYEPVQQEVGKEPVIKSHWINQFDYAKDQERVHVNFFKAEFISVTVMPIDTNKQVTRGVIYNSVIA